MTRVSANACDFCPEGYLQPVTGHGRTIAGRAGIVLAIPDDLVILTCDGCGVRMLDGAALDAIGAVERAKHQ
jgi:hypothetical protein